jgi:hypothetical protein
MRAASKIDVPGATSMVILSMVTLKVVVCSAIFI